MSALADTGRQREEIDLGALAGVSDQGLRHHQNEDAMALATVGETLVAVVCDGVSSAPGSALASRAAADAARAALVAGIVEPPTRMDGEEPRLELMGEAVVAAQAAVHQVPVPDPRSAPSCTLAAAVVAGSQVTVGWIGDSRIYLLDDGGPALLAADDTWAAEAARAGLDVPAGTGFGAHALTRWLGANAGDAPAHLATITARGPAWLIVCSDGLWNYAADATLVAGLVAEVGPDATPRAIAGHLTAFALNAGGHDNITTVVARLP